MGAKSSIVAGMALALACAVTPAAAGELLNGSFEDINADWAAIPALFQTPGEWDHKNELGKAHGVTYQPVDGVHLGVIQAGFDTSANFISQVFTTKGGTFSGSAAFLGEDYLNCVPGFYDCNDYGYVRLFDENDVLLKELFYSDLIAVKDFGYTDWTFFSTVLGKGTYRLEAGVANGGDGENPSFMLVDNFRMNAVPEPSTWALLITGFGLAGAALRRRKLAPIPIRVERRRRR